MWYAMVYVVEHGQGHLRYFHDSMWNRDDFNLKPNYYQQRSTRLAFSIIVQCIFSDRQVTCMHGQHQSSNGNSSPDYTCSITNMVSLAYVIAMGHLEKDKLKCK